MANPLLDSLAAQVKASVDAEASATLLINGMAEASESALAFIASTSACTGWSSATVAPPARAFVTAAWMRSAVLANTPAMQAKKKP